MDEPPIMGIENEFVLCEAQEDGGYSTLDFDEYFDKILPFLKVDYFEKTDSCVRLSTGGSFYNDGDPEITTAPFYLERGAITSLVTNLFWNINVVLDALSEMEKEEFPKLFLQGYSAHYSFTFPYISSRHETIAKLLATTVNPAIHLFTEYAESSGVMYRYRESGRIEICGDFVANPPEVVAAVALQASILTTIDDYLREGNEPSKAAALFRYVLPEYGLKHAKKGDDRNVYFLKMPQVIKSGRKAIIEVEDLHKKRKKCRIEVQELLEDIVERCEPAIHRILTEEEMRILHQSVSGKRVLPLDRDRYPKKYLRINPLIKSQDVPMPPLVAAYGNATKEREIAGGVLGTDQMYWDNIIYTYSYESIDYQINVFRQHLVAFERMINDHPSLLPALLEQKLTPEQQEMITSLDIHLTSSRFDNSSVQEPIESSIICVPETDLIRNVEHNDDVRIGRFQRAMNAIRNFGRRLTF